MTPDCAARTAKPGRLSLEERGERLPRTPESADKAGWVSGGGCSVRLDFVL